MRTGVAMALAYNGSAFHGWQIQANAASVQGRVALGSRAGARLRRRGDPWAGDTDPSGLGPVDRFAEMPQRTADVTD